MSPLVDASLPDVGDDRFQPPSWPVELVALDLDGTCLSRELELLPRVAEAVSRAAQRVPVVIATGRMYQSALPWAHRLGISTPLICYQGALVQGQPTGGVAGQVISHLPLAAGPAAVVLQLAREHDWHCQFYVDDEIVCEKRRPELSFYEGIAGVTARIVTNMEPQAAAGSTKVVCVVQDPQEQGRCEAAVRAALDATSRVTRSMPEFVEVTDARATKSLALTALCERLGVSLSHAVVVGDAPNDVDMLRSAGLGIAIASGPAELLRSAHATCRGPREGGVADLLLRLDLAG